ncbi:MAG TPA: hypothetical protein VGG18_00605 [Granulicella sp.]|jgi:hypothetical protein
MLDVHAPEHGIHGVRDFFIHLLTITVGLFIALTLEAGVEALHHRHERKEAEAMIRQELMDNRERIQQNAARIKTEIAGMTKVLQALEALSQGQPPGAIEDKDFDFGEGPIQDSAWRTASSTGALSYMEYAEVERFSDAHKEQDQLEAMEQQTLDDYLQLGAVLVPHGVNVSPERAKEALPYARHAIAHLRGMYSLGIGTLGSYEEALKN